MINSEVYLFGKIEYQKISSINSTFHVLTRMNPQKRFAVFLSSITSSIASSINTST